MTWDVTVTDTLAESYLSTTSANAGVAADGAASRKESKYQALATTHSFIPLAFETLGPINAKGLSFFNELGGSQTFSSFRRTARDAIFISAIFNRYPAL